MTSDPELLAEIQKGRLFALIRRMSAFEQDRDEAILLGFALGLRFVAAYPDVAAAVMANLEPPYFNDSLRWVVYGPEEADPEAPVN